MTQLSAADKDKIDADYQNLYMVIADTVDAAVRSDILCQKFQPTNTDGEYWMYGSNIMLYPDGSLYDPNSGYIPDLNGWVPGERRDHFAQSIGAAFADWDCLPSRAASDPALKAAGKTASALALTTTQSGGKYEIDEADPHLGHDLQNVLGLRGFKGHAMDTLNSQFTNYLLEAVSGQYAVAGVVGAALQAEQDIWVNARSDILSIARAALDAMKNANPWDGNQGGSGEFPEWLNIVGAVAGAAAAFFSGGAAVALGGVATAVGTLSTFNGAGSEDKPGPLGAQTPDQVLSKLTSAIKTLNEHIVTSENRISSGCAHVQSQVQGAPTGVYVLPVIKALTDDDPDAYLSHQGEVEFNLETLTDIGGDLHDVATDLQTVTQDNAAALDYGAFDRPGGLGSNPYGAFGDIWWELDEALRDTQWKVSHTGQQLVLFAQDFRAVDEHRGADADRLHKTLVHDAAVNKEGSGYSLTPQPERLPNGKVLPE